MKTLRLITLSLATVIPATGMATVFTSETVSVPVARSQDASVDEITFAWENAMVLSAADPCASYLAPRYNSNGHEGNYDDDGQELRI
ncbi:MAG TPA: hypothetical protein PLW81_15970 [Thiobacillaceae bacterium]|nr:hypothetical protein [Thiobacillaceae bacterium]